MDRRSFIRGFSEAALAVGAYTIIGASKEEPVTELEVIESEPLRAATPAEKQAVRNGDEITLLIDKVWPRSLGTGLYLTDVDRMMELRPAAVPENVWQRYSTGPTSVTVRLEGGGDVDVSALLGLLGREVRIVPA